MRRRPLRLLTAVMAAVMLMATAAAAQTTVQDAVSTFDYSKNMKPLGIAERVPIEEGQGINDRNTDIAFWGKYAFQGHFTGFRIIDISDPADPVEIVDVDDCGVSRVSGVGGQGDVVVWDNVLVRSWDGTAGGTCSGLPGTSGLHIFDISDVSSPVPMAAVNLPQGSHTASGLPDLENNRLLVYSSPSNANGIDVVEVPLDDLAASSYLHRVPSGSAFSGALVNFVDVHDGGAAGTYVASGSNWHPDPTAEGVTAPMVLANAPVSTTFPGAPATHGCGPFVGFPAGSIALVDRGTCGFIEKVMNAEAAGAVGVIVITNTGGNPTTMGGETHEIGIPSGMVSQATGAAIKANLPATGTLRRHPDAINVARVCHDTTVILGDVMKAACAGGNGVTMFSLDPEDGATLENPALLWSRSIGVGIAHSTAFSWDGEVLVFGHEPGGGTAARCQESSLELDRTLFFLDAEEGHTMGTFLVPRFQDATENCTWHNFNVVPTDKRHILVAGNYQMGVVVVDFTDHDNIHMVAHADPAPLEHPTTPGALTRGGDWSTYWYNGHIYESDTRRGLIIWKLTDPAVAGARKLPHLNPQTQETSFPFKGTAYGKGGKAGSDGGGH